MNECGECKLETGSVKRNSATAAESQKREFVSGHSGSLCNSSSGFTATAIASDVFAGAGLGCGGTDS